MSSPKNRIVFIGAGDIWFSMGSRTLFRQFIRELRHQGFEIDCFFFQFRMEGMPESSKDGTISVPDFPDRVFTPLSIKHFQRLPRIIYRLQERVVLWIYLTSWMKRLAPEDALILHGNLGLIHVLPRKNPAKRKWWYKVGVIEEEENAGFKYRLRKVIESFHARRIPRRLVVSNPMAEFLNQEYGVSRKGDFVLPCLVDHNFFSWSEEKRSSARKKIGAGGRFVVLYLGSAAPQQSPGETVEFFQLIRKYRSDAFFWVLSGDLDYFRDLLSDISEKDKRIEKLPYDQLPEYLPAADLSFLLRQRGLINRVCSPVKFAEYMANAIPVIIGPESGQYTSLVEKERIGAVADPGDPGTWQPAINEIFGLLENKQELRNRCLNTARKLSWQHYRPFIKKEFS